MRLFALTKRSKHISFISFFVCASRESRFAICARKAYVVASRHVFRSFCGLYLNCNDVDCTHGMTSHLIVNFFSRVDSRIVFVLSRVEISCWLCLRDFCVGIQILFRVLLRALTCVLDLCRLVRSSCCFCCASDDFVEPCMLSSRSACAAS